MIYGYARCSTNETKQDIKRQKRELKEMGAEEIYMEYESGTKWNREELNKILRHIQKGDTLMCTEISRITRSTKQLCSIIDLVASKGIRLVVGTFIVDCTCTVGLDPMTEGMVKMMGVFAEMERNMTVERTRSGLRHAKAKGIKLGRPKTEIKNIPSKVLTHFDLYNEKRINLSEYARLCGITRKTLYKYLAIMTDSHK